MSLSIGELTCINNFPNINYYKKMADKAHSVEHSDCEEIECSQQLIEPKQKKQKLMNNNEDDDIDSDDIDGITYSITLDGFFKACLLIFNTPFDFQQQLMFSLPNIKRQLKQEKKPLKKIVFAMIKAVTSLYDPTMKDFVGWDNFYTKLIENSSYNGSYDGTLIPNVKKFFENFVKMPTDSTDSSSSYLTTPKKISNTSTSSTIAINPVVSADAQLSLESILYDIPAPSTTHYQTNQNRISTISEIMRVRTSDGLNSYELDAPMGDYYVTMRIIPASVVTNPQIQSAQYWKHAKQELKFSVKERSSDPVSQSTFRMVKEVSNKIINSPQCTQTFRPFSNWNNFS